MNFLSQKFQKGTEELANILNENLGEVHSIRINPIYDKVFNAKMYTRSFSRSQIDDIEKLGYRLIRVDMQTATLTFKLERDN
jgi:hypothetical protein